MMAARRHDHDPQQRLAQDGAGGLRGVLRFEEPMARHTVWGIGGPAREFYEPADEADLIAFVRSRARQSAPSDAGAPTFFFLGLGSNLLVRDGGLRTTVVRVASATDWIERVGDDRVDIGAGMACPKAARFCSRAGLLGLEFFAGIPGTVGGALAMNAGAFGGETWPKVESVRCLNEAGDVVERTRDEFKAGYRHVEKPAREWFLSARFALDAGDTAESGAQIKSLLARRAATQPLGLRSCGSVFRNPPGDHAARLIEACGLKGHRIGAAEVSPKHANFIINTGHARAADVEALIHFIQQKVRETHGVDLVPEVLMVGEPASGGQADA